jgi:hypothetical protein
MEIPDSLIGLVALILIFGIPIVGVIGHYSFAAWKAWLEVGLKRDMVARGYTAQEIIEVLAADKSTETASSLPNVPPAKPVKQPAYSP